MKRTYIKRRLSGIRFMPEEIYGSFMIGLAAGAIFTLGVVCGATGLMQPVKWWHIVICVAVASAYYFLLHRSGEPIRITAPRTHIALILIPIISFIAAVFL